jgi:hypothetical protein
MTILDDIRSNTITTLHLSSVPKDYFAETKELVSALEGNTSLEKVIFDKDFLSCVYGSERGHILDAVADLKNIHEVQIADVCLEVNILTQFISSARGLRSFTLERMVLQGVQSDFDDLESELLQSTGVKTFHINDCVTANVGIDLEKVVNAGKSINAMTMSPLNQVESSAITA